MLILSVSCPLMWVVFKTILLFLIIIYIIIIIIVNGKRDFCNNAFICSLTQVVSYERNIDERNIGTIHTREEKTVFLLYK